MKKVVFLAAFISIISCVKAQEGGGGPQNAIKINPLSLIFTTGNISYERAVGATTSVQLGAFFSGFKLGDFKYSGWGVTPEVRFYFGGHKEALNGIYAAPFVRYQNFTIKVKSDETNKTTFNTIGGGALIGWEKSWSSGFVLDLFLGPQYNSIKFKNEGDDESFDVNGSLEGFGLRTGITIGFSF